MSTYSKWDENDSPTRKRLYEEHETYKYAKVPKYEYAEVPKYEYAKAPKCEYQTPPPTANQLRREEEEKSMSGRSMSK